MFIGIGQRFVAHQLEHLGNRRIAGAELEIGPLIALAILQVQRDDAIVMLRQERDGVLVGRR